MIDHKHPPIEGDDGRLYFNYPLNARYLFKSTTGAPLFEYEILSCEYVNGEERYYLACNGAMLPGYKTIEQVELIFSFYPYEITDRGEPEELPLLDEEVRLFYNDLTKELKKANSEANAKLKGTDYFRLKSQIEGLSAPLRFAKSSGDEKKAAELMKQVNDLKSKQFEILNGMGIDYDVLTKKPKCKICGDSGFVADGHMCECALARSEEIKLYNAELRLAQRK